MNMVVATIKYETPMSILYATKIFNSLRLTSGKELGVARKRQITGCTWLTSFFRASGVLSLATVLLARPAC